ncbi:hypothetical protein L4D20_10815 [Vibrio kyushuensis]|uniref:hypothetical protein n=1 Tax=Vibrio kyushuensis TaxID=2910249 RepID=UPI003D11C31D
MSASVLIILLVLFGFAWNTLFATLMIVALTIWFHQRYSIENASRSHQMALRSIQRVFLPKLNKQLEISYQDSNQSITQITTLFAQLSHLVKQRDTMTSENQSEEKQRLEKQMNQAYNELIEVLQHGDRNLQRQAGVKEGLELIIEQLRLLEQEEKSWDESWLVSELSRITSRTELAVAEKSTQNPSNEGITYF